MKKTTNRAFGVRLGIITVCMALFGLGFIMVSTMSGPSAEGVNASKLDMVKNTR